MTRLIDADAFCEFLRRTSTRQKYSKLALDNDNYTVAGVLEAVCEDLEGKTIHGFDNVPTVSVLDICKECNSESYDNGFKAGYEENRWHVIETKEDNPKVEGFYLVTIETYSELEGKMKYITAGDYYTTDFGGQWVDYDDDEGSNNVIAWKPMPEPYTESEAKDEADN